MTRCLRTMVVAFLAFPLLAAGIALAQAPAGNAKVGPRQPVGNAAPAQQAPAAPQPAQPPAEDPRLNILLNNWEISSAKIKSLHGKHLRSRSNSVFGTDSRATGKFYFEAPDKGRIDLTGKPPAKGDVSALKTKDGEPYKLTADRDEKWVCDGKQVLMINDAEKQYEAIELPEEMRGKNIVESPLPFLFGMKAAEMKKRFKMDLIGYDPKTKIAKLIAIPLQGRDAQNFIRAEIQLDTSRYLPTYVALTDPAGTIVTRYIFQDVEIDDNNALKAIGEFFGRNPFAPDLRGYKKVQPPPVQQVKGEQAPGAKGTVNPAGGKNVIATPPSNTNRPTSGTTPRTTFQQPGNSPRPGVK